MVQHWSTCKFYNIRYALLIGSGFERIFLFMGMICGYEKYVGKEISPLRYDTNHKT